MPQHWDIAIYIPYLEEKRCLGVCKAHHPRQLEDANLRLNKLVANRILNKGILQEAIKKKDLKPARMRELVQ